MISRGRHQKKEVADVLVNAEAVGLLVEEIHSGHRWGAVTCVGCDSSRDVWSTPRDPGTHAKQIARFVARHIH